MNCLRQTSASFYVCKVQCTDSHALNSYSQSSHKDHYATTHMLRVMTDFCNRTTITHVLRTRKGLEDHRLGSDSTAWATELWFYCQVHCWEKKIPSAVAGFHFHIWQPSVNDTTVSRPARKIVCHLSRFTDTNEQAKCCCIKRLDITFRVTNKLNAIDLVVSGWRGAEFFQPKLQRTVQEVGSWAASELHTSTAVHPSPKPETTKAFAPHVRKSWRSSAFGEQQLEVTISSPGFISRHSPFLF